MALTIIKGTIVSAPAPGQLDITEPGYLVAEDGVIRGVYGTLPAEYTGAAVEDFGDCLVLQTFADLHLHAPQYPMVGTGMDLTLLDWLNPYTFPAEARFSDPTMPGKSTASSPPSSSQTAPPGWPCSPPSTPTPR